MMARNTDPTLTAGEHNPFANMLLQAAADFASEKEILMGKIDANRTMLRSLRTQGYMDAEQDEAAEGFYPTRERKSKDDDTNTTDTAAAA